MKSLDSVRSEWSETIAGLEQSVTVRRADAQVQDAIATINAQGDLISKFERERQAAVRKQREAAQKETRRKAESEAQAKAARVAKRERMRALFTGSAPARGSK